MAIEFTQSAQIQSLQTYIIQNNDIYGGRNKMIEHMDLYYSGLELDSDEQKLARWERTPFYLYYPKIISSFTSSIFKKPPHSVLPIEKIDNVDLLGNSLDEYASQIPHETLKQGFCATIVDYSDINKTPYFTFVKPESFVSFQIKNDNGYPELAQFIYNVIEERQDEANEFKLKTIEVHYVWDLSDGQVRVRKYEKSEVEEDTSVFDRENSNVTVKYEEILVETRFVIMNGKPMEYLPIIIHGKSPNNFVVNKSVLQDVSDLNISLINRVVDQVEVLHLTALPTPWITGVDPEDPNIPTTIGSSKLWVLGEETAKVGMLEFTGKSSEAHRDYIEDLKGVMATEGAQILKKEGVSRETATSVLIRTSQETAIITDIVKNNSSQIESCLKIYFEWMGEPTNDIIYQLNSDFINVDMEPNAQIALVRSWLDGAVSFDSMFHKMKEGEIIPANRTVEQELELINQNPPPFPAKEKDKDMSIEIEKETVKLNPPTSANNGSTPPLKGSNLETGTGVKNTEIRN